MKIPLVRSLKFKMPLLVLAATIPLIVISILYASNRAAQRIRLEGKENMALKAELLAEGVNEWTSYNYLTLKNLSSQTAIIGMNPEEQHVELETLTNNYEHIYLAMVVDKETGFSVARNDDKPQKYYGDRIYIKGGFKGDDITYQAIISRTNGKPAVCMGTPVFQDTEIIAAAGICTNLEIIAKQVGKLRFGQTGYSFVVNEEGTVLAHSDREFTSGDKLKDISQYPPVKKLLSNQDNEGLLYFTDYEGIKWISYYLRLDNGWGVVINQQQNEFFANEQEFFTLASFIAIVTVFGVSIVTWLVANHAIAPLTNLSDAATAIANGKWNYQVKTSRRDEIGSLAESFNKMTLQLKILFKKLEERIKQRTDQLNEAKKLKKEAEETAKNASKARDRFVANVSHELRTPLNSILGYARIVQRELPQNSSQLENLKIIEHSGNHLLTLINDILDLSKNQLKQIKLVENEFKLTSCLEEVFDIIRLEAETKNIRLDRDFNNLPQGIRADEKRLRQILINLLANAVKFTEKGKVTLTAKAIGSPNGQKQKLRFEVQDTGIGMSQQELNHIFQPFFQLDNLEFTSPGTGLGLSISKELVELMGGKLEVNSQVGQGSTFWFDLVVPVVKIKEENQTEKIRGTVIGYTGKVRNILVVDDKEENQNLLIKMLNHWVLKS